MNEILLGAAVTIVTASAIWDFVKFLISRKDGKDTELRGIKKAIEVLSDKVDRNQAILARTHILRFDDELINEMLLSETVNGSIGNYRNPFRQSHYLLLNLAVGGDNGGPVEVDAYPMRYEIDYVRIYQKK